MEALLHNIRGKREAQRNASPLVTKKYFEQSAESAKYGCQLFRSFRASRPLRPFTRGDAPHVVRRLPLAFIFRAFGACRWLSYSAFGACLGFHIPRLWRSVPTLCKALRLCLCVKSSLGAKCLVQGFIIDIVPAIS